MEDNNYSMGPSTCKSPLANMFKDVDTKSIAAGINKLPITASLAVIAIHWSDRLGKYS